MRPGPYVQGLQGNPHLQGRLATISNARGRERNKYVLVAYTPLHPIGCEDDVQARLQRRPLAFRGCLEVKGSLGDCCMQAVAVAATAVAPADLVWLVWVAD